MENGSVCPTSGAERRSASDRDSAFRRLLCARAAVLVAAAAWVAASGSGEVRGRFRAAGSAATGDPEAKASGETEAAAVARVCCGCVRATESARGAERGRSISGSRTRLLHVRERVGQPPSVGLREAGLVLVQKHLKPLFR